MNANQKIITTFILPPIPIRDFDWQATFDDYDGAEDSKCPMGFGSTEQEAINNLLNISE